MPQYEFECAKHGRFEETRRMNDPRWPAVCQTCGHYARNVITLPHFTEDRTRFWRDPRGGRYSAALGCELPDSRSGIAAVAKAKGVELDAHEMPHVRRAVEVGRANREGAGLSSNETYAHIREPGGEPITLAETLRRAPESTKRAIAERINVGYENWSDRGAADSARMAQKGAEAVGAGASVLNMGKPVETV